MFNYSKILYNNQSYKLNIVSPYINIEGNQVIELNTNILENFLFNYKKMNEFNLL